MYPLPPSLHFVYLWNIKNLRFFILVPDYSEDSKMETRKFAGFAQMTTPGCIPHLMVRRRRAGLSDLGSQGKVC